MTVNQNDIIYFIVTDRFYGADNPASLQGINRNHPKHFHGGNIDGIREKIPYLKHLGVTAIWITPVYLQMQNEKNIRDGQYGYHGYWALDFNSIDPHFYVDNGQYEKGSKLYLRDFVDELHRHGIKLILDMVVNHTGYHHPATHNASDNPTPIRRHWFNDFRLSAEQDIVKGALAGLPDLDLDLEDVIDYQLQTIFSWLETTGIDAIRMDTVKHVEKAFWYDFKTQVCGKYPDRTTIGEVLAFDMDTISHYQKYWGFDSLFDFPLQKSMVNVFVKDHSLKTFQSAFGDGSGLLEKDTIYSNHNRLVTLLDNHDLSARFFTDAMSQQMNDENKAARITQLALSFMFTIRGIPQIYYGTEIGMQGGADPDNRRDFEWHKIDENHEVKAEYQYEKRIFDHLRHLIHIRKTNEALWSGSYASLYVDDFLFVFIRYIADNVSIVAIHNGWLDMPYPVTVPFGNNPYLPKRIKEILNNRQLKCQLTNQTIDIKDGAFQLVMPYKQAFLFIA